MIAQVGARSWWRWGSRASARLRYLLLFAWGVWWFLPAFDFTERTLNDWLPFEVGARSLVHWHHALVWSTPALHLYTANPQLQIGPPPLLAVAAFERFSPHAVALGFGLVMVAAGVGAVAALAACARRCAPQRGAGRTAAFLLAELALVAVWSHQVGWWRHLDDVMAIAGICTALWLCVRRDRWWLIALVCGTAVAAKPWAVVALPLLLGLPRAERARTVLLTLVVAAAWWLPFVVAAPGTVQALGSFRIYPTAGSVLALAGLHGNVAQWLRPVQLILGLAAAGLVAQRGRWLAAPLAGIAVRVIFDPFVYSYYGMGPLLFAFAWDITREGFRWSVYTLVTLTVEFALPTLGTPTEAAVGRLAWAAGLLVVLIWRAESGSGAERLRRRQKTSLDTSLIGPQVFEDALR